MKYRTPLLADKIVKLDFFKDIKHLLAGGSCLSAVHKSLGRKSKSRDFDFFFEDKSEFNKAVKAFSKIEDANVYYESEQALTINYAHLRIQLIKIFRPFNETITSFDLNNSKYFSVWPFDEVSTQENKSTLYDISLPAKATFNTVVRVLKYHDDKDIHINELFPEIFEMLKNPKDEHFEDAMYAGIVYDGTKESGLKIRNKVMIFALMNSQFSEYVVIREKMQDILPYWELHDNEMQSLASSQVPLVKWYVSKEIDNDFGWIDSEIATKYEPDIKLQKYVEKYFPELVL